MLLTWTTWCRFWAEIVVVALWLIGSQDQQREEESSGGGWKQHIPNNHCGKQNIVLISTQRPECGHKASSKCDLAVCSPAVRDLAQGVGRPRKWRETETNQRESFDHYNGLLIRWLAQDNSASVNNFNQLILKNECWTTEYGRMTVQWDEMQQLLLGES